MKFVYVNPEATMGAELGVNIYSRGQLLDPRQVLNFYAPGNSGSQTFNVTGGGGHGGGGDLTTDDVAEGSRKYFSVERAQDAVGGILLDSPSIDFTYNDGVPFISAALTITGVTAGSYGDSTHIPTFTVDSQGRLTAAGVVSIVAGVQVYEIRKIVALRAY